MNTRDDAPRSPANRARVWWVWFNPAVVIAVLIAVLGAMYLAYAADPEANLHDFPIALVNSDEGDVIDGKPTNVGDQISSALSSSIPAAEVRLRLVGANEAGLLMDDGKVFGAIVIPSDFTKRLGILAASGVIPGDVERPILTVETNPRIGPYATATVTRIADRALTAVNTSVGRQLSDTVTATLNSHNGAPATELTGAARLALDQPIKVVVVPHRPLASGTGQGLSAFFYALTLVLAGFIGAMIIHTMVDAGLGFTPTEYGPWFAHLPSVPISRLRTLIYKWLTILAVAPVASAILLAVGAWLGVPDPHALALFLYSALVIAAVGVTALSVLAALGTAGLLVNLVLFVVLGLPSTGGTIPVEETPRPIAWLSHFEPMRQVYLGIRAISYFDARLAAGLSRGLWMSLLGLAFGITLGITTTYLYDRRGMTRTAASPTGTRIALSKLNRSPSGAPAASLSRMS